jgi:hypothetical protein
MLNPAENHIPLVNIRKSQIVKALTLLSFVFIIEIFCVPVFAQKVSYKSSSSIVLDSTVHYWNNSCGDLDKLISYNGYQYTCFWDVDYHLVISRRKLSDNQVQNIVFPDKCSNPSDGHRYTVIGISPGDGRLHISYDHHNNPHHYRFSDANWITNPPDKISVTQFSPIEYQANKDLESKLTYPQYFNDKSGNLFFVYRNGRAGNGEEHLNKYNSTAGKWEHVGIITSGKGTYTGDINLGNSISRYSYANGWIFDSNDRLHFAWTWREPGDERSNHDVCYAYSDDYGVTWKDNSGNQIANLQKNDPIDITDTGAVVVSVPQLYWMINSGTMAVDANNQPHIFTYKSVNYSTERSGRNVHQIHYWRTKSGKWDSKWITDTTTTSLYGNRGLIVIDNKNNCYLFYTKNSTVQWINKQDIPDFSWQAGGYAGGTFTGPDPEIITPDNLGIDITNNKVIKIKMQNFTSSSSAEFYFTTKTNNKWQSKTFAIIPNDPIYREYLVDMSNVSGWKGTLQQLKFNPATGVSNGSFSMDYIRIGNNTSNAKTWEFTSGYQFVCSETYAYNNYATTLTFNLLEGIVEAYDDEGYRFDTRRFRNDKIISLPMVEKIGPNYSFAIREFTLDKKPMSKVKEISPGK